MTDNDKSMPLSISRKILYARPESVHFCSSTQASEMLVYIHNNSSKPVRLQYALPTNGPFQVRFTSERLPFVSPGLSEQLIVKLTSTEQPYSYDYIGVRCEEITYVSNAAHKLKGGIIIPIHAYPSVNPIDLPASLDFGYQPVGSITSKHFDLCCSIPIEFEYEICVTKPHPSFIIYPLNGIIPACGTARVEVEFRPTLLATASAEIELSISQFNFLPRTCCLIGSSRLAPSPNNKLEYIPNDPNVNDVDEHSSKQSSSKNKILPTKAIKENNSYKQIQNEETKVQTISDVQVSENLSSVAGVNIILTQKAGKLKPKELKKAIDANREARKQQKEEQLKFIGMSGNQNQNYNQLSSGRSIDTVPRAALSFSTLLQEEKTFINRHQVSRQIQELVFLQDLAEIAQSEADLEFQSHKIQYGHELLTSGQIDYLQKIRKANVLELEKRQRDRLRNNFSTINYNMLSPSTKDIPYPPRGMLPANYEPIFKPDFKMYKNDLWTRRKRVVQRFVRGVSTCIIRLRAQKHLTAIRKWLGDAPTKSQVHEKVLKDWHTHDSICNRGSSSEYQKSCERMPNFAPDENERDAQVYLQGFPVVLDSEPHIHELIKQPEYFDFPSDPFTFLGLRERNEALLFDHKTINIPPFPSDLQVDCAMDTRVGCFEECGKSTISGSKEISIHQNYRSPSYSKSKSILERLPPDIFLRPNSCFRPIVPFLNPRETELAYDLRPTPVHRDSKTDWRSQLEESVGSRSLFALKNTYLRLHLVYRPRTEKMPIDPLFELNDIRPRIICEDESDDDDLDDEKILESLKRFYADVWSVNGPSVPQLVNGPFDIPYLSDSESDGEEDELEPSKRPIPTWDDALNMFINPEYFEGNKDEEKGVENPMDNLELDRNIYGYEDGELLGRANGLFAFERYRHLIRLEREYNKYREELFVKLPNLKKEVADAIDHPDYKIVIEGQGPNRPLHQAAPAR